MKRMINNRVFYRAYAMRQLAGDRCVTRWLDGGRVVEPPAAIAAERARLRSAPTAEEAEMLERMHAGARGEYRLCGEPIKLRGGAARTGSQSVVSARPATGVVSNALED